MEELIVPTFGLQPHTAVMLYVMAALIVFSLIMSNRMKMIPGKLQSILELTVDTFSNLVEETMGHKGKKYFPIVITFALFIFFSNFMGLIPGLIPPTSNFNSTFGFAITVFFLTHIIGVKEHGLKYLKSFIGPVWWLFPLMLPIEIIGHMARPLSLSLRLFGNMMGHEQIVAVLLVLMPFGYPLLAVSTVLGIVVAFLQAFIFTLLTMLYIGGALEEAH